MPRVIHPNLIARLRRPDATARQIIEAQVVEYTAAGDPMEHVRSTSGGPVGSRWDEADSLTGFTVFDNGDLRLEEVIATLVTNTTGTDEQTDLTRASPIITALVELADSMDASQEISRVKIRLNPRRSGSQKREVVTWRMQLFRLVEGRDLKFTQSDGNPNTGVWFSVQPIADAVDVAVTGDGEGDVTFDYSGTSERPRPKNHEGVKNLFGVGDFTASPTAGVIRVGRHYMLVAVYALNASGDGAGNVSWDYDSGTASLSSGGFVLRGRRWIETPLSQQLGGLWQDGGSSGGVPRITIEHGTYTEATVEFVADPFDVGDTPTGDLELVGHVATPQGTEVTLEVRNDADSDWVEFEDGDLHSDVGIGKTMPRKMRATLTPNAAGNLTPTLKKLGLRAITRIDLSRVCEVREWEEAFDPQTGKVEANLYGTLVAVKDGERDFHSAIEDLLSQHYPRHIVLRAFIGDTNLPRSQWLHKTDFTVGDWEAESASVALRGGSILAKLKDLVPPYSPGSNYAPDGDQSAGSWTTHAGSGSNLYQQVDEDDVDETDYIRSGTSPSNQQVVLTLPTPSDTAGRRHFVDCNYGKDASGGEQIDLKIQLYQSAVLIAEITKTDIGPDRVMSSMELTDAQIQTITDYPNLRLAFSANTPAAGTGRRAQVYWARFRTGGRREVVTYTNETLKDACDDLVDNRLALESRYRGPLIESTEYTVSKQLTGIRDRNPSGRDIVGKDELTYLAHLAGGILHEKQGLIVFTDVFGEKSVSATFPSREITITGVGPGLERRIPEFFVGYRYDPTLNEFADEAHAIHQNSLDRLGRDGLGAPKWADDEVAKWIDTDDLATDYSRRMVEVFGCGQMLWSFTSTYRYPELHIGDLVAVETDQFLARDPNSARQLRGRQWVAGIIQRADFWGRHFTVWVRGFADIKVPTESDPPAGGRRGIGFGLESLETTWEADHLIVHWTGAESVVRSVKVATSTSAYPAAGTGTAAEGRSGSYDAGSFAAATAVYVTVTPYTGAGATGVSGKASKLLVKRPLIGRAVPWSDGKYGGLAVRSDGDRLRGWLVNSTDQTLSNDTETDLTWDTENADVGGLHSGSSKDITIPSAGAVGMWVFIANIVWEASATGIRELLIYQDPVGLSKAVIAHVRHSAASAGATAQTAVAVVNAPASGTVFYVAARQTSGGDLDVIGDQLGAGTRARGSYFHAIHIV